MDFRGSESFLRSGNRSNVVQFNLGNYFINSRATLLALGGGSWPGLGSDVVKLVSKYWNLKLFS